MSAAASDNLLIGGVRKVGQVTLFLVSLLAQCGPALARPRLVVHQIYNAGARSLIIIMLSGLFVGMVLGLTGIDLLQRFGSEDVLGVAAALGLLKELGPVVTALLFAGRAGTSLTSEIGLMRATDQLTAMEMMAVDPMRYVAAPRFLGGIIAMPLLVAIFDIVGLFGAQLVGVQHDGRRTPARSGRTCRAPCSLDDVMGRCHEEPRVRLRLHAHRGVRGLPTRPPPPKGWDLPPLAPWWHRPF